MRFAADAEGVASQPAPSPLQNGPEGGAVGLSDELQHAEPDRVDMTLAATGPNVRYVRLLAGAVADDLGFDYEEVEDLRIAVSELTFVLLDAGDPTGPLEVSIEGSGTTVDVRASCPLNPRVDVLEPPQLMAKIIEAVVDSFDVDITGECARFELRKSRKL